MIPLNREFYRRPTARVARDLIGKILCIRTARGVVRARIVETEAYLGVRDRACHSFGGRRTDRTEAMYRDAGHAYVYFIYGMHFCLNVTTRGKDIPQAVLIRAVQPISDREPVARLEMRTNGPGKICKAYGIGRAENGIDLLAKDSRIWIEDAPPLGRGKIAVTPRIGINGSGEAKDKLLRFAELGNPYVSGKRAKKGVKLLGRGDDESPYWK